MIFLRKPGGYDDNSLTYNLDYINKNGKVKLDSSNEITAYDLGDGTYMLQNGHHRFKAAKIAGLSTFPIERVIPYEMSVTDGIVDLPRGLEPREY